MRETPQAWNIDQLYSCSFYSPPDWTVASINNSSGVTRFLFYLVHAQRIPAFPWIVRNISPRFLWQYATLDSLSEVIFPLGFSLWWKEKLSCTFQSCIYESAPFSIVFLSFMIAIQFSLLQAAQGEWRHAFQGFKNYLAEFTSPHFGECITTSCNAQGIWFHQTNLLSLLCK